MMAEYNRRDFARRGRYTAPSVDAKIVVMGNTGVGKTSLLHRYTQNKFDPKNTTSTTGAFFVTKKIDMNGTKVRLQLWDTAGQERFRSMAPMYYRGAHAALVLYDITNLESFQAARGWLEELKRNCDPDLLIYLVGSKADLTHARQVKEDTVRHSLSTWFPPPQPPAPPVAPTISTFGYIRPRLTSLTSLTSIRSSTSSPDTSDTVFETVAPANNASRPPRKRVDSTGGLMRSNTASPPRGRIESPVPLGRSQSIAASAIMSPSRFGRLVESKAHAGWSELVEDGSQPTSSDTTAVSDGYEWGLGPDMKLYEVSAKDGDGIPKLFNTLIGAIISRRDAIEAEQALKRRDSVMLSSNTPAWAIQADQEAAAEKARSGWSCCGG